VVRLQDHAQHIAEPVEGCRRALTTMFSVMLPRNPFPASFRELLDVFKSSQRIHDVYARFYPCRQCWASKCRG
jgi:hypothetical protein